VARKRIPAEEAAARKARIVEMRRARRPFDQIGAEFGITGQRAHQIYWEAINERPAQEVAEHRAEELELYDLATRRLMAIAMSSNPNLSARTQVEAWNAIRGYSEARRRLLGLDAPTKSSVNIVTRDAWTAEMEAMAAELAENDDTAPAEDDDAPAALEP
jgi:hypothetical protein